MITAVIPSKDAKSARFCIQSLRNNSSHISEIILLWNGDDEHAFIDFRNDLELLTLAVHGMDVYAMFNLGAQIAKNEYILFANDDMYFPKEWDNDIVFPMCPTMPLTFTVVEPGVVGVSEKNICKDYGKTIDTFQKEEFELDSAFVPEISKGLGWYMPVIFHKSTFEKYGYYQIVQPFPYPNDIIYFDYLKSCGVEFYKSSQMIYHFQRLSQRQNQLITNQTKLNLCCGEDYREGYLNVDYFGKTDLNVDLTEGKLPFEDNSFEEVVFQDAIEHFRREIGLLICTEIFRCLKPGGMVEIRTPELITACQDYMLGYNQFNSCSPVWRLYGRGEREGQVHKYVYTADDNFADRENYLPSLLLDCGFTKVEKYKPRDDDEFGVRAYKHV